MQAFKFATAAAALVLGTSAFAGASVDANVEFDAASRNGGVGTTGGGRVEVNVAGEAKNGDNFVRGRGTVSLKTGGTAGVDDAWGQFGNSAYDVKLGAFEGADLFPTGKDNSFVGVISYNGNKLRGRAQDGRLHAALGINVSPALRFELGVITEKNGAASAYGFRPVVSYSAGPLSLRVGMESGKTGSGAAGVSASGFGATVGYAMAGGSVNLNFANGSDAWKSNAIGLNGTFGDFGAGVVMDTKKVTGAADEKTTGMYAAYSFPLLGVKGASITPSIGYAKTDKKDAINEIKVRMNYAF